MKEALDGQIHHAVISHVAQSGYAPTVSSLCESLDWSEERVETSLTDLSESHGIVLKPNSFDVWAIHPFSLMPTPTWVTAGELSWWANCAWCSLGIGAALGRDIRVSTRLGAHDEQLNFEIRDGRCTTDDLLIHFPFPPTEWWKNPYNPCGYILFFDTESRIDAWCARHQLPKGEAISVGTAISLASAWFGDYLDSSWKRKSSDQVKELFGALGLTGRFWDIGEEWR